MIYLDASVAAESPVNCGIGRTIRRIYGALRLQAPVTPVVWSEYHRAYSRLVTSERLFLERPFARDEGPVADPYGLRYRWRYAVDRKLNRWWRVLPFEKICRPGNTLLLPAMDDDGRPAWIGRAAADGRLKMAAVFYDAIAYSHPDLVPGVSRRSLEAVLRCMSRCRFVVTCSGESRETLLRAWRETGCGAVPVVVEPLPADLGPRGQADPSGFDRRRVLYVSSLAPRKNHVTLFAACRKLWDEGVRFDLELVGRQFREQDGGLPVAEAVRRMEQEGRPLRWLKHVSDETLAAAYRACSFTVYPSLIEGFGLPIHESLWFGRPCICGTNGALGEVSGGGGCLPCDQTQVDSLASAMRGLLTDRALYVRLSEEAAQRPLRSWEDYAGALRRHLGD